MNIFAKQFRGKVFLIGKKWADFVNLSTIIQITSWHFVVLENFVTKSMKYDPISILGSPMTVTNQ